MSNSNFKKIMNSGWTKTIIGGLIVGIILYLIFGSGNKIDVNNSSDTFVNTGEISVDIPNAENPIILIGNNQLTINSKENLIQSIFLEAKLTVTKKGNTEYPPIEVNFVPVGDSHAYFKNNKDKVRLEFQSPVNFLQKDNGDITIVNRFALQPGSALQNKQLNYLNNFENLSVPIVTVVYGDSFDKFKLLEITLVVNGKEVWKNKWEYDIKFEKGPRFSIPLK